MASSASTGSSPVRQGRQPRCRVQQHRWGVLAGRAPRAVTAEPPALGPQALLGSCPSPMPGPPPHNPSVSSICPLSASPHQLVPFMPYLIWLRRHIFLIYALWLLEYKPLQLISGIDASPKLRHCGPGGEDVGETAGNKSCPSEAMGMLLSPGLRHESCARLCIIGQPASVTGHLHLRDFAPLQNSCVGSTALMQR